MATLAVLKFNDAKKADQVLHIMQDLQRQNLIQVQDAAVVRWPSDAKKPKTEQLNDLRGPAALTGSFWGLLFGLIFFVPLIGLAVGATMGALSGHLADIGIDDNFIKDVKDQVTPGTSALFLLTSNAVQDRVVSALKDVNFEIIATNLSDDQEEQLRTAFAEE